MYLNLESNAHSFKIDIALDNITIVGADVIPALPNSVKADPWTLTGFRVLGTLKPYQNKVSVSHHGHHNGHIKPRLGVCIESDSAPTLSLWTYCTVLHHACRTKRRLIVLSSAPSLC